MWGWVLIEQTLTLGGLWQYSSTPVESPTVIPVFLKTCFVRGPSLSGGSCDRSPRSHLSGSYGGFVSLQDVGHHGRDVVPGVRLAREKYGTGLVPLTLELGVEIEKISEKKVKLFVHLRTKKRRNGTTSYETTRAFFSAILLLLLYYTCHSYNASLRKSTSFVVVGTHTTANAQGLAGHRERETTNKSKTSSSSCFGVQPTPVSTATHSHTHTHTRTNGSRSRGASGINNTRTCKNERPGETAPYCCTDSTRQAGKMATSLVYAGTYKRAIDRVDALPHPSHPP